MSVHPEQAQNTDAHAAAQGSRESSHSQAPDDDPMTTDHQTSAVGEDPTEDSSENADISQKHAAHLTQAVSGLIDEYARGSADERIKIVFQIVQGDVGTFFSDVRGDANIGGQPDGPGAQSDAVGWAFADFTIAREGIGDAALTDLSYVLALASLSGVPRHVAESAADTLINRMIDGLLGDERSQGLTVATRRSALRAAVGCSYDVVTLEPGRQREELTFQNPGDDLKLLIHAHSDLRLSRPWVPILFDWMRRLGKSDSVEKRIAAGRAAGALASLDFSLGKREFFDHWTDGAAIDALDTALTFLMEAPGCQRDAEDMIRSWAGEERFKHRRRTVALLAGGALGQSHPDLAFASLAVLMKHRKWTLTWLAYYAYVILFFSQNAAHAERTLTELKRLRQDFDDPRGKSAVDLLFLALTEEHWQSRDGAARRSFMQVLGRSPDATSVAADLLNQQMFLSPRALWATQRLEQFLRAGATPQSDTRQAVIGLCHDMYRRGDADQRERLVYWLSHWSQDLSVLINEIPVPLEEVE